MIKADVVSMIRQPLRADRKLAMPKPTLVPAELLDPVVAYFAPQRVILFGSSARGEAGPDSDFDLLVVVDDDTPPERATLAAGFAARRSYRRAADVIPIHRSAFERKRRVVGSLAATADAEGVVVYERP